MEVSVIYNISKFVKKQNWSCEQMRKKSELCNKIEETHSFILQKCGRDKMMFLVLKNLSFEYFDKEILKKN